jgi:hypothetical protein
MSSALHTIEQSEEIESFENERDCEKFSDLGKDDDEEHINYKITSIEKAPTRFRLANYTA